VHKVAHKGLTSLVIRIEDYIVSVALQLTKMHVPITQHQGLELANSLISRASTAENVQAWKKR